MLHLGWSCRKIFHALRARLRPLRHVPLAYLHRMAKKYALKELDREAPPGRSWMLCACHPITPGYSHIVLPYGPIGWKVKYLYRRTALIHRHFHPLRRSKSHHLEVLHWPDDENSPYHIPRRMSPLAAMAAAGLIPYPRR